MGRAARRAKRVDLNTARPFDPPAVRAAYEDPPAGSVNWRGSPVVYEESLLKVAHWRKQADDLEARSVTAARAAGASWHRISVLMGGRPSGEQLRRRYVGRIGA